MKYVIKTFNEAELKNVNGRIVAVLKTDKIEKLKRTDYLGIKHYEYEYHLTCLVEVE